MVGSIFAKASCVRILLCLLACKLVRRPISGSGKFALGRFYTAVRIIFAKSLLTAAGKTRRLFFFSSASLMSKENE